MPTPVRLGVFVSHPIQYQAPLWRMLANEPGLDVRVLFYSDFGAKPYHDHGFGKTVQWDLPLLDGYPHEFLSNVSPRVDASRFFGVINPDAVARILRREFDVVWVHGWQHATTVMVVVAAIAAGVPVLMRGEANLLDPQPRWKSLAKRVLLGPPLRRMSACLSIGTHNTAFYRSFGVRPERILSAPYSVDNDSFVNVRRTRPGLRAEGRADLGLRPDRPAALFVGKLREVKRPLDLLEAFARARKVVDATLVYVGEGALRPELERRIAELGLEGDVVLAGFRNQSQLAAMYAAADVFVLPSIHEPWGLVVNEAMCFGLPVVASDKVGAAGDIVRHGENGFLFPAGDVSRLSEHLARLLGDAELRRAMGARSEEIIAHWSNREIVAAVHAALARIRAPAAAAAGASG